MVQILKFHPKSSVVALFRAQSLPSIGTDLLNSTVNLVLASNCDFLTIVCASMKAFFLALAKIIKLTKLAVNQHLVPLILLQGQ
jgi:hypothetical protein